MTEETKDLLRQDILPVLLGNGMAAHRLSAQLSARYGVGSLLCGAHRGLLDLMDPTSVFFRLCYKESGRLAAEQLVDFFDAHDDLFCLLVPMTADARAFVSEQSELLETRFVCVEPNKLCGAWLDPTGISTER